MRIYAELRRSTGQVSVRLIAGIVVVIAVVLAAIFFLRPKPAPIPAPDMTRTTPLETVAPAESAKERGDSAREIIEKLRANTAGIDYSDAHLRAQEFQAAGNRADAQLLYFFAARGGYAPAAFDLGTMYDPNQAGAGSSLVAEPDPFQAYKWYRSARDKGNAAAEDRLAQLRDWAQSAAAAGDVQAERLLLQWESQ